MAASKVFKILLASGSVLLVLWVVTAMFTALNLGSSFGNENAAEKVDEAPEEKHEVQEESNSPWRNIDLTSRQIPAEAKSEAQTMKAFMLHQTFEESSIVYRVSFAKGKSKPYHLLFLHGAQFDSEIWERLGTLQLMSALGYNCTAVDLPGYGKSGDKMISNRVNFMKKLFVHLNLPKNVVIVSPSMSGSFSLPLVLTKPEFFAGFVPIAPVGTSIVPQNKLRSFQVPTLYVYGSKDKDLGVKARDDLKVIPNLRIISIENAGHAAYLDQPETFHTLLYNFLLNLQ